MAIQKKSLIAAAPVARKVPLAARPIPTGDTASEGVVASLRLAKQISLSKRMSKVALSKSSKL